MFMTEIILNPESIMKKYLQKFSIDFAILSDLDKFIGDFEERLGHSIYKMDKCDITRYEEKNIQLPVFSGYDEFSQKRVGMRPNMLKDLAKYNWSLIKPARALTGHFRITNIILQESYIKKFELAYMKELLQFDAICYTITGKDIDERFCPCRRGFKKRASSDLKASIGSLSSYFGILNWEGGMSHITVRKNRRRARFQTDSCSRRNAIAKRTFLNKEDLRFIFDTISYCSRSFPEIKYCFLLNGTEYLNYSDYCEMDGFIASTWMFVKRVIKLLG